MAATGTRKKKVLESVSIPAEPVITITPEPKATRITPEHRKEIEKWMASARNRSGLMAYATFKINKGGLLVQTMHETHGACTGALRYSQQAWGEDGADYLAVCFNGESPGNLGPGTIYRGQSHDFIGGPISRAWLEFLTDPKGYWRDVLPFIVNLDDLETINMETGFIFANLREMPAEPSFNFLIATRWAQEQNKRAVVWYDLIGKGIDPAIAFIAAHWYKPDGSILSTPSHTIAYSPPKTWAKKFFKRAPHVDFMKTGDKQRNSFVGLVGRIGENSWFNHEKTSLDMMEGFFGMKNGRMVPGFNQEKLIEEITKFVNS